MRRAKPSASAMPKSAGSGSRATRPPVNSSMSSCTFTFMRGPVHHPVERIDERALGPPRMHAGRFAAAAPVGPYTAHEQVQVARDMRVVVVVGQPAAQVAMQCDRIEQRLQVIRVIGHRDVERARAIGVRRRAEMVRLPVDDPEAAVVFDDHVDETLDETGEHARLQCNVRVAVRDQQPAQRHQVERGRREQETHFVEPLRGSRSASRMPGTAGMHDIVDQLHHHRRQARGQLGHGLDRPVVQRAERGPRPRLGAR